MKLDSLYTTAEGRKQKSFNAEAAAKYDTPGKKYAARALTAMGWTVKPNDKFANGKTDFSSADLIATKDGRTIYIEVELKSSWLWHYTFDGIHITGRKDKYVHKHGAENLYYFMGNTNETEFYIISALYVERAMGCDYTPDESGCFRMRKFVKNADAADGKEDFIEIHYDRAEHWKTDIDGGLELFHNSDHKYVSNYPEQWWDSTINI